MTLEFDELIQKWDTIVSKLSSPRFGSVPRPISRANGSEGVVPLIPMLVGEQPITEWTLVVSVCFLETHRCHSRRRAVAPASSLLK